MHNMYFTCTWNEHNVFVFPAQFGISRGHFAHNAPRGHPWSEILRSIVGNYECSLKPDSLMYRAGHHNQ